MLPDSTICLDARKQRNASYDGVFVVGDGQRFCRPSCPTRVPAKLVRQFFGCVAAARSAGLVPCKRCVPERAPRLPDWRITDTRVLHALRLIEQGALALGSVRALAERLGTSAKTLDALFALEFGASVAGLGDDFLLRVGMPKERGRIQGASRLCLQVREPYDADWVFGFLDKRSLPGLEEVVDGVYRRKLSSGGTTDAWLAVRYMHGELLIDLPPMSRARRFELLGRVGVVFDVSADPQAVDGLLKKEQWLRPQVTEGIRVPGAWDGFETAVRAILGQQVSVARARNLAIDLMQRFGRDGFPTPAELVEADVSAIGMPGKRGGAVRELAAAVLDGRLHLSNVAQADEQFKALCALPGIGPWTAGYVSMRIAGDANAFPRADWVILKQLALTAVAAERYSQAWQPFRAYALMYIWQASSAGNSPTPTKTHQNQGAR